MSNQPIRNHWLGIFLMLSDLTFGPSFKVKRGLTVLISCLFEFLEVCNVTQTYRKSWAGNRLIWSDFTFGFSFKVKRCLNGFSEFFFWWIQFASVLRCDRSSFCRFKCICDQNCHVFCDFFISHKRYSIGEVLI